MESWKKIKRSGSYQRNLKKSDEFFLEESRQLANEIDRRRRVDFVRRPSTTVINYHQQVVLIRNEHQYSQQQTVAGVYMCS